MGDWRIRLALLGIYFIFAILLNSVGTVILQIIGNYGVSKAGASVLEGFKDLPIAIVSFLVASSLPRYGFKKAMLTGLVIAAAGCIAMPLLPGFLTTKLMFLCIGISFALVKVSVYSSVGLITSNQQQHAGFMNILEGFFMVGVLSGYWLFGLFIDSTDPKSLSWLTVYWLLAALCLLIFLLILTTPFDESKAKLYGQSPAADFTAMLKLLVRPMVCIYIISAFIYVLIEQGIGTWLPTFNNEILKLPSAMSVQATSIFAACIAVGRLSAGYLMRRVSWYPVLNVCVIAMGALVLLTMPLTHGIEDDTVTSWRSAPIAAFIFPCIGLFMSPIYPVINSVMLSALPKHRHSAMTGLVVIFSALGGTTGSLITGFIFGEFDGQTAFYLSLVPITVILLTLYLFKRETSKGIFQTAIH